jgi:predicted nucleic acid-binding protein
LGTLTQALRSHQQISVDTAPFIYLWEKHPRYVKLSEELFGYLSSPEVYGSTSIIALIEVCIYPQRQGRADLVTIYENALLHSQQVQMWPVNVEIARQAVQLRAAYDIHIPDALHLATAITAGATLFVTNDRRLQKVTEIEVLSFEDYVVADNRG